VSTKKGKGEGDEGEEEGRKRRKERVEQGNEQIRRTHRVKLPFAIKLFTAFLELSIIKNSANSTPA
jgi:hypothetical protein